MHRHGGVATPVPAYARTLTFPPQWTMMRAQANIGPAYGSQEQWWPFLSAPTKPLLAIV